MKLYFIPYNPSKGLRWMRNLQIPYISAESALQSQLNNVSNLQLEVGPHLQEVSKIT